MIGDDVEARRARLTQRIEAGSYPSLIERMLGPLGYLGGMVFVQGRPLPLWITALVTASASLFVGYGLCHGFGEATFSDFHAPVMVATAFVGACTAMAAHVLTEMLLSSVRSDILPAVDRPKDLDVIEDFLDRTFRLRRQAVFVLLVGPVLWALLTYQILAVTHGDIVDAWSARFIVLVACLQSTMALYYTTPVITFLHKLGDFHLRLFPASPRDSEVIVNLQHTATEALYVFAVLFVMMTLVGSRLDLLAHRPARLTLALVTWGPLMVVFIGAQRTFTRIITRAKFKYLGDIQARITRLQRSADEPEDLGALNALLDYHDRIRATPNSAIDVRSGLNFLNALLLPTLAFLFANWDKVTTFMEHGGGQP